MHVHSIISESDSVVSVQEEREPMFYYKESGLNLINPGRFKDLSFDKERLYRFNGSIIASLWNNISKNNLGMGLGIFISKNLIENMGGNLKFYNTKDENAVVEITFDNSILNI